MTNETRTAPRASQDGEPAPYGVELTVENVRFFEMVNTLCAVENYDQLLFSFEAQQGYEIDEKFHIPPADILIVLMTLSVIPDYGTSRINARIDPFNVGRASFDTRSLKILKGFVELLQDKKASKCHNIQLLRSQFFIVLDHINCNGSQTFMRNHERDPQKRRKTNSGVRLETTTFAEREVYSKPGFKNLYSSYVSTLEHKPEILKNTILTSRLCQEGEFWNCVAWALLTSVSEDTHLYERSKQWIQLLRIIFDVFELQHDYYIQYKARFDSQSFVLNKKDSPLVRLFESLESRDLNTAFCDILLIGFDYSIAGNFVVHPVYPKETKRPDYYVPRNAKSKSSKFAESIQFRHRLLRLFLLSLRPMSEQSEGHNHVLLDSTFSCTLGRFLSKIEDLCQLKHFFSVRVLPSSDQNYMQIIAQATLRESIEIFGLHESIASVEKLRSGGSILEPLIEIFSSGFPPLDEDWEKSRESFYTSLERCDICLLAILRNWENDNELKSLKACKSSKKFIKSVKLNDQRREEFAMIMKWEDLPIPLLYTHLKKLYR
ncbi:LANO_0H12354g1_1 [Lachancea nothofagi CBS 11611]|uniref:LANO_0H12354g1_1 n=1 Tax=Lachancea nothofagi CBS 11611 TaxID=1266666 RepID=A0A1G4KMA0_9SACH|nr:LANO_0H12354g1_1 [Lachancea nothofagi CBS 11611]